MVRTAASQSFLRFALFPTGAGNISHAGSLNRAVLAAANLASSSCGGSVLTYLMQVYTALLRRNTVALCVDTWSGQTGDAVELLARLFPEARRPRAITSWSSGRQP